MVDCGQPTSINASPKEDSYTTTYESSVTFECNENYGLPGSLIHDEEVEIECLSSGRWADRIRCGKHFTQAIYIYFKNQEIFIKLNQLDELE